MSNKIQAEDLGVVNLFNRLEKRAIICLFLSVFTMSGLFYLTDYFSNSPNQLNQTGKLFLAIARALGWTVFFITLGTYWKVSAKVDAPVKKRMKLVFMLLMAIFLTAIKIFGL